MQYYRHYSFDLWLTLIRSNPDFKRERAKIFHEAFNPAGKSIEVVVNAFRQVDLMCNAINEKTGKNIGSDEMHLMVISLINDNKFCFREMDTAKLYEKMEQLIFRYLPVLYTTETTDVLAHLKQKGNCTMSILSNTGFIKGVTLRKVLKELEIDQYFDFQLYSDEVGLSKPNPALFNLMIQQIKIFNNETDVPLNSIVHIGDNPATDVAGADAAGIKSLLVNSNNIPLNSLLN